MQNIYLRFPQGKTKTVTLSYDDGVEQDKKLISILDKYGLKATFNINSGLYTKEGAVFETGTVHRRMTQKECINLYKNSNHEVAVHTLTHPFLDKLNDTQCIYEVLEDRKNLENDFETIIKGMAYPFGTYSDKVIDILAKCGIAYSRTVNSTYNFDLPTDWLTLNPTCRHTDSNLFELTDKFLNLKTNDRQNPVMFYLWGHSYEFEQDNNWDVIEKFSEKISNKNDIWYATNIEIYNYIKAFEKLEISADGTLIHNPTSQAVYFSHKNYNSQIYKICSGETIKLQ